MAIVQTSSRGAFGDGIAREKLPEHECETEEYIIIDEAGKIDVIEQVSRGIDSFYEATGVRPAVVTDSVDGSIDREELDEALAALYDEIFSDDNHMIMLVLNFPMSRYMTYLYVGEGAKAVIDDSAKEVIEDIGNSTIKQAGMARFYMEPRYGFAIRNTLTNSSKAIMKSPELYFGQQRIYNSLLMNTVPIIATGISALLAILFIIEFFRKRKPKEKEK